MNVMQGSRRGGLLIRVGSVVLVFQLIVFQRAFGLVERPGVSGTLRDVVSGGLLVIATVCIGIGVFLRYRAS